MYWKVIGNIIFNDEIVEVFLLRLGIKVDFDNYWYYLIFCWIF